MRKEIHVANCVSIILFYFLINEREKVLMVFIYTNHKRPWFYISDMATISNVRKKSHIDYFYEIEM